MGAQFLSVSIPGSKSKLEVEQEFSKAQVWADQKKGHGWTGDWNMANGLKWASNNPVGNAESAETYLRLMCEKWKEALVVPYKNGDKTDWMIGALCANDK